MRKFLNLFNKKSVLIILIVAITFVISGGLNELNYLASTALSYLENTFSSYMTRRIQKSLTLYLSKIKRPRERLLKVHKEIFKVLKKDFKISQCWVDEKTEEIQYLRES